MSGCVGFPGSSGGGGQASSLAFGTLGLMAPANLDSTYDGTFFILEGEFNTPSIIANAGLGIMNVSQTGAYFFSVSATTKNNNTTVTTSVHLIDVTTGIEVPFSEHEIFENNTDNDQDFIGKGLPITLTNGHQYRCEFKTSVGDTAILQPYSTWSLVSLRGTKGPTGSTGGSVDQMVAAYRESDSDSQNPGEGTGQNMFLDTGGTSFAVERYDTANTFDPLTGLWLPNAEGYYQVNQQCRCESVDDQRGVEVMLYNETSGIVERLGSVARNEGGGRQTSVMADLVYINGTDTYSHRVRVVDGNFGITIMGALIGNSTFFSAYRVAV